MHFRGFLSQAELRDLYAASHIFLHPSETPPDQNQEGVPNSVLEAMATGLPVVGTKHGGIPEAVEHGRGGLLVEERDFEALATALKEIAQSSAAFREMGMLGSEFVVSNFEQSAQIRELERHYDEVGHLSEERARVRERRSLGLRERFSAPVSAK